MAWKRSRVRIPSGPPKRFIDLQTTASSKTSVWSLTGVQIWTPPETPAFCAKKRVRILQRSLPLQKTRHSRQLECIWLISKAKVLSGFENSTQETRHLEPKNPTFAILTRGNDSVPPKERAARGWLVRGRFEHHHVEEHPALVPSADPTHAPAIYLVAERGGFREHQEFGLDVHAIQDRSHPSLRPEAKSTRVGISECSQYSEFPVSSRVGNRLLTTD